MSDRADTSAAPPASWSEQDGLVQCGPILQTGDITELAAALAKFQGDVTGAAKAGANPHFRSSYARLEDAWGAAREALAEHGLSVTQWPDAAESGWLAVSTRIMHSSGQWLQSTLTLPLDTTGSKNPAQQYGSTQTYAQRYAFMAALGLPPVDDDAQHAGEQKPSKGPKKRTKKGKAAPGAEVTAWSERLTSCTTMDELVKAWAAVNKVKGGFSAGQLAGLQKDKTTARP